MTIELTRRRYLALGAGIMTSLPFGARRAAAEEPVPASPPGSVNFLALGDWGQRGSADQRQVAAAMAKIADTDSTRFVLTLGDNFYGSGVKNVLDPHWKVSFEEVYTAKSLQCPWYPILGNHDRKGIAMAQVAYSQMDARWCMPAPFYWHSETLADDAKLDMFFLDTETIIEENSGIHSLLHGDDADEQVEWLGQALAASTARWKIVVGHHPIYSGGPHGTSRELIKVVLPLLHEHHVNAYVCGHDHNMQHLVVDGMDFIICGAGASFTHIPTREPGTVFANDTQLGFLRGAATPHSLAFEFRDVDGNVLHTATLNAAA